MNESRTTNRHAPGPSTQHDPDLLRIDRPEGLSDQAWAAIKAAVDRYFLAVQISLLPAERQAEVRRLLERDGASEHERQS